jgi:hypothetical protein
MQRKDKTMYRITANLKAGHDMESVVFKIKTDKIDVALMSTIKAMKQLGFKADDYELLHSMNLD